MRYECVMRQRRAGRDHLGAAHMDATVGLLRHVTVDVLPARGRARCRVAVDRRMDDRVVDEWYALAALAIPAPRILLIGRVELGVGAERCEERGLVIGRAAEPAIGDARPFGDRIAAIHLLV